MTDVVGDQIHSSVLQLGRCFAAYRTSWFEMRFALLTTRILDLILRSIVSDALRAPYHEGSRPHPEEHR